MYQGISINELAAEVSRQTREKRDFLVDTRHLTFSHSPLTAGFAGESYPVTPWARNQIADAAGIPRKYADRLEENPELVGLFTESLNRLFHVEHATKLMRTLDGRLRSVQSNRYRAIDNDVVIEAALPVLHEQPELTLESMALTESRLYIKAVFPRMEGSVVGDLVQYGVVISNSEVGAGAFSVRPLIKTLRCLNGMILDAGGTRRVHLGRAHDTDSAREVYRDETLAADDRAFLLKLQDETRAIISRDGFESALALLRDSRSQPIEGRLADVVEVTAKRFTFREDEKDGLLRFLAEGGDFTRYGLANAVTRLSQDAADYDRATELERVGGQIIELPRADWQALAA